MARKLDIRKERRALVTVLDEHGQPIEQRRRATVVGDVLAICDDGLVVHVPTGRHINPPQDGAGGFREVDARRLVDALLEADPQTWAESLGLKLGDSFFPSAARALRQVRDSVL